MTTIQFYEFGRNMAINVNGTKYNIRLSEDDMPIEHTIDDGGAMVIVNAHGKVLFKSTDACTFMRLPIVNE